MAEKESKNKPKDLIEAVPEEIAKLEEDPEVKAELEKLDSEENSKENIDKKLKELDDKEKQKDRSFSWNPKTKLGKLVKSGEIKDIDVILAEHKKILEPEIVESLLSLEQDLISIGQAKGKFGGGKRRAWRQTQKKTMEGNVLTFSTMAVVGDRNGHVGYGMGKSKETLPAREKAYRQAKLNIVKVKLGFESPEEDSSEAHTIPFKVTGKAGSVRVKLMPAPRGTGLVIGDEAKKVMRLAGIKDIYCISSGKTSTTYNFIKACVDALSKTSKESL